MRRSTLLSIVCPLLVCASFAGAEEMPGEGAVRRFTFEYEATVGPFAPGTGAVDVFLPLAVSSARQRLIDDAVDAPISGRIEREPVHGNRFWHGRFEPVEGEAVTVRVTTRVERPIAPADAPTTSRPLTAPERARFARYLGPNARVVVDHPMLDPIRTEIHAGTRSDDPVRIVRGIYDWVAQNVEYKKVGTGWGNGDTFWACTERYGNCTDFHALFISLARSEGVPARFQMGFPVPTDRDRGEVAGYHCWVEVWLPEHGWLPIDASEAAKDPARRDFFFGGQGGDRIHLSTGRDLELGAAQRAGALNYFAYPHVEIAGERYAGPIETRFRYAEIGARDVASFPPNARR